LDLSHIFYQCRAGENMGKTMSIAQSNYSLLEVVLDAE
jgi:hypothetical protein